MVRVQPRSITGFILSLGYTCEARVTTVEAACGGLHAGNGDLERTSAWIRVHLDMLQLLPSVGVFTVQNPSYDRKGCLRSLQWRHKEGFDEDEASLDDIRVTILVTHN